MLFNSIDFCIFLPIVFGLYWMIGSRNLRGQNILLLAASYIFYGWWDYRFLSLIILSSVVDYFVGIGIFQSQSKLRSKLLLTCSLVFNLGLLLFFKYFNFFEESFVEAFTFAGYNLESSSLKIILPVGISFYTFQTLSYSIDIYRGNLHPTRDPVAFFAFVSFFPQLVAGPIERASNLVPQFLTHREFNYGKAVDGMRQMLWGLAKKVVIADNCATVVDQVFANSDSQPSSMLIIGAVFFAFQIYGDFSGYSDMAIGMSRLFGFDLMRNFAYPYFSRDIAEFWRRWHISLSTWFRDYLYIPLGGSRVNKAKAIRNVMVVFLVSGFWHGANWTFIAWGFIHALLFLPLLLGGLNRSNLEHKDEYSLSEVIRDALKMLSTFILVCFAWVFFRAQSIGDSFNYIEGIFSNKFLDSSFFDSVPNLYLPVVGIFVLLIVEWAQRFRQHGLDFTGRKIAFPIRLAIYYSLIFCILYYGQSDQDFIYFQF